MFYHLGLYTDPTEDETGSKHSVGVAVTVGVKVGALAVSVA
jgi:hypothetical protein